MASNSLGLVMAMILANPPPLAFGQAVVDIRIFGVIQSAQAAAELIKATSYAQVQAYILLINFALAVSVADIKQVYSGLGQAQAEVI